MAFSTYNPIAVYPADGVQTNFAAPDMFYDVDDVRAVVVVDGVEINAVRGVDFEVVVVGRESTPPFRQTGYLQFIVPPESGNVVPFILPSLVQDQPFEGRPVTPRQHERVHDRHVQSISMLFEFFNRGYRSPLDTPAALRFIVAGREGYVPTWDEDGNLIEGPTVQDVNAVAGFIEEVVIVAGIAAQVVIVADIAMDVSTLAPVAAQIAALGPVSGAIAALAPLDDELIALAPVAADIAALAIAAPNIAAVAAVADEVNTVAGIAADVTVAANNMAAIIAAPDEAAAAAQSAADAEASAIAIAQAAVMVGSTMEWNGPVPAGWLRFREGGTFNRATFPDLATFWDNNGAFWGMTAPQIALGQFPDTTGYVSRHAGGLGPAVGAKQEDAYQEHHHAMTDAINPTVDHNGLGVGGYISNGGALGYYPDGNVRIRPGRSIAAPGGTTPRTAAETRVKTFGVRYIIKASSAATNQGLVDMLALATQAADNTNRIAVLEAIGKPFTKEYVSAEQVITAGGLLTLTHSLGVAPKLGSVQLVCKTTEHGYVPGQSIEMGATGRMFGTESNGFTFASDAASISVKQGSTGSGQLVIPVGGSIAYITAANWRLIVRAWA